MKNQALFSSKDKIKKIKCRLLHFLFGALRVKCSEISNQNMSWFQEVQQQISCSVACSDCVTC